MLLTIMSHELDNAAIIEGRTNKLMARLTEESREAYKAMPMRDFDSMDDTDSTMLLPDPQLLRERSRNASHLPHGGGWSVGWVASITFICVIFVVIFAVVWRLLTPPPVNPKLTLIGTPLAYPGGSVKLHGTDFAPNGIVTFTVNGIQASGTDQMGQALAGYGMLRMAAVIHVFRLPEATAIKVDTDGTFNVRLILPGDLQLADSYTIQATEQGGQGNPATVATSLKIMAQSTLPITPTATQGTIITYMPKTTPTPTPTPPPSPTPAFCVMLYPATIVFTIAPGTGVTPGSITIGVVFCGSGTVIASASPGIIVSPAALTFTQVGTSIPVTITPLSTLPAGTYFVKFTSINGGNPGILSVVIR